MDTKLLSTDRPIAIYYVFKSEVSSITKNGNSRCSISLNDGKEWKLIRTTIGTISFNEKSDRQRAGILYTSTIEATCPGHDETTPEDMVNINGVPVLLRMDYRDGLSKIVGNTNNMPRLFIQQQSNTVTKRSLSCTFKATEPNLILS